MKIFKKGSSVTKGIVFGKAYKLKPLSKRINFNRISITQIKTELSFLESILGDAILSIEKTIKETQKDKDSKDVLLVYKKILLDPIIKSDIQNLIKKDLHTVSHAIHKQFLMIEKTFKKIDNPYMRERIEDFIHIKNSLLETIKRSSFDFSKIDTKTIIFAHSLSPAKIIELHKNKNIKGICTVLGSKTSHTSIIVRAFGIKSIIGVEKTFYNKITNGDEIILDSSGSKIIVNPDKKNIKIYKDLREKENKRLKKLLKIKDKPAITKNGKHIKLLANIELPEEMNAVIENKAEGIGLFRSEMFYLNRSSLPDRLEQFNVYKFLAQKIFPYSITIRTIDVGGDKDFDILNLKKEENPNLGLRGIRMSLEKTDIFKTQLEAILMASAFGKIKILLPMISSLWELDQTKKIISICKSNLKKEKIPFDDNIKLGIMIEVPSSAILADIFAKNCDFFSIGTNDLVQYLLAVDRNNKSVEKYYDENHPAIFKIIRSITRKAHKNNIKVVLCGEMASDISFTKKMINLGIDELSVNPTSILEIKNKIINI